MPKLWSDTIEAHRRDVRDAILNATARLVAERGVLSVTMSEIAEAAGIGRATLYKYFADVEAVLAAWHERHVASHLVELVALRDRAAPATDRLEAVLQAYAIIAQQRAGSQVGALLHRDDYVADAERALRALVRDLIAEGASMGDLRDDVAPEELAGFCLHALSAAASLRSKAAIQRLVNVTLSGLRA